MRFKKSVDSVMTHKLLCNDTNAKGIPMSLNQLTAKTELYDLYTFKMKISGDEMYSFVWSPSALAAQNFFKAQMIDRLRHLPRHIMVMFQRFENDGEARYTSLANPDSPCTFITAWSIGNEIVNGDYELSKKLIRYLPAGTAHKGFEQHCEMAYHTAVDLGFDPDRQGEEFYDS